MSAFYEDYHWKDPDPLKKQVGNDESNLITWKKKLPY